MWVRGLKLSEIDVRTFRKYVAPHVGAWIETRLAEISLNFWRSHPMWVRGLKQLAYVC